MTRTSPSPASPSVPRGWSCIVARSGTRSRYCGSTLHTPLPTRRAPRCGCPGARSPRPGTRSSATSTTTSRSRTRASEGDDRRRVWSASVPPACSGTTTLGRGSTAVATCSSRNSRTARTCSSARTRVVAPSPTRYRRRSRRGGSSPASHARSDRCCSGSALRCCYSTRSSCSASAGPTRCSSTAGKRCRSAARSPTSTSMTMSRCYARRTPSTRVEPWSRLLAVSPALTVRTSQHRRSAAS